MIIDFHTHIFPEKVAGKALAFLGAKSEIIPFTDGTAAGLEKSMNGSGIDISVNMPVATTPDQVTSINTWSKGLNNNKIQSFAAFHPELDNASERIRENRKSGFKGIKLHPEFQNFSPDDPRLWPIWEACVENNIFVMFHAGADLAFKPPFRSSPAKFATLHGNFPSMKMILAHFGSYKMWDELEEKIIGLPIYLDTSFTMGFIEDNRFVSLVRKHGADKIIFGTDSPWRSQKKEIEKFLSLPFDKKEKDLIMSKNAMTIMEM